eukprot:COSAG02_NODE_5400_length_4362_cov_3.969505_1_plen_123_part_00
MSPHRSRAPQAGTRKRRTKAPGRRRQVTTPAAESVADASQCTRNEDALHNNQTLAHCYSVRSHTPAIDPRSSTPGWYPETAHKTTHAAQYCRPTRAPQQRSRSGSCLLVRMHEHVPRLKFEN